MPRLRDFIRAGATPPSATATFATFATFATLATGSPSTGPTVATVAYVAVATVPDPAAWLASLRSGDLSGLSGERWALAADALESLIYSGAVDKALALGWEPVELVGVCRAPPHDSPSRAGLIWSVKPGDTVPDVRRAGCVIAYGNVRHIWKRTPIAAAICLPWELAPAVAAVNVRET